MRLSLAGRMLPQDFIQPPFAEILLTGQYANQRVEDAQGSRKMSAVREILWEEGGTVK